MVTNFVDNSKSVCRFPFFCAWDKNKNYQNEKNIHWDAGGGGGVLVLLTGSHAYRNQENLLPFLCVTQTQEKRIMKSWPYVFVGLIALRA